MSKKKSEKYFLCIQIYCWEYHAYLWRDGTSTDALRVPMHTKNSDVQIIAHKHHWKYGWDIERRNSHTDQWKYKALPTAAKQMTLENVRENEERPWKITPVHIVRLQLEIDSRRAHKPTIAAWKSSELVQMRLFIKTSSLERAIKSNNSVVRKKEAEFASAEDMYRLQTAIDKRLKTSFTPLNFFANALLNDLLETEKSAMVKTTHIHQGACETAKEPEALQIMYDGEPQAVQDDWGGGGGVRYTP